MYKNTRQKWTRFDSIVANIVNSADPEHLLSYGAPRDEYDPELRLISLGIKKLVLRQRELVAQGVLPVDEENVLSVEQVETLVVRVWQKMFGKARFVRSLGWVSRCIAAEYMIYQGRVV